MICLSKFSFIDEVFVIGRIEGGYLETELRLNNKNLSYKCLVYSDRIKYLFLKYCFLSLHLR